MKCFQFLLFALPFGVHSNVFMKDGEPTWTTKYRSHIQSKGKGKGKGYNTKTCKKSKRHSKRASLRGKGASKNDSYIDCDAPGKGATKKCRYTPSKGRSNGSYSHCSDESAQPSISITNEPTLSRTISLSPSVRSIVPTLSITPSNSPAPSGYDCLSSSGRLRDVNVALESVTSDIVAGSVQELAYNWLKDIDTTTACDGTTALLERYVLAIYYYSTSGDDWNRNSGWLSSSNHCINWFGISCNNDGRVESISMNKNNVDGIIPSELGLLLSLSRIMLYDNHLIGTIPIELYGLEKISFIDIEANSLTGELFPPELFQTSNSLEKFRASVNAFEPDHIPTDIGNLTKLKQLWIADSNRVGTIPAEIGQMTLMEKLVLSGNTLSGSLPSIRNLTNLRNIIAHNNTLTGTLSDEIGSLLLLQEISFANNLLTGTIPGSYGNLNALEELYLSTNALSGTIPPLFGNLDLLRVLELDFNNLRGPIPTFNNTGLEFLNANENQLTGSIPSSLFELENLQVVYLSNNTLSGQIPAEYGKPQNLRDLWLNGNELTGFIPDINTTTMLPSITEILFNNNRLSGEVPNSLCVLRDDNSTRFGVLHADCFPRQGNDLPNNLCGCCTSCYVGKDNNV